MAYRAKLREAEDRRRRVSQRLSEAERLGAIGLLAADVAHDLNNFLTPIVMATEMLQAELEGDKRRQELAQQASEAAERAREMVWRLLESARSPPAKSRMCVRDVVRPIREMLQDAVGNSALDLELPDADIHVLAAPQALDRVLVNLVINAGEAIAEDGSYVEVRFERTYSADDSTPQVRIRVRDNGKGIDPAVRERLFSPLVTTKAAGHGLGLASVKRIVEEHDGSINAWNVEQGAIFEVILPVEPDVSGESSVSSS